MARQDSMFTPLSAIENPPRIDSEGRIDPEMTPSIQSDTNGAQNPFLGDSSGDNVGFIRAFQQSSVVPAKEREMNYAGVAEVSAVSAALAQNFLPTWVEYIDRKSRHEPDPNFDPVAYAQKHPELPMSMLEGFVKHAESEPEAEELTQQMFKDNLNRQKLHSMGFSGIALEFVAGLADIDSLATGGIVGIGKMSRALKLVAQAAEQPMKMAPSAIKAIAKDSLTGAAFGGAFGTGMYAIEPQTDASAIVGGALFGLGVGSGLSVLGHAPEAIAARARLNKMAREMPTDFATAHSDPRGTDRLAWTGEEHNTVDNMVSASLYTDPSPKAITEKSAAFAKTIANNFNKSPIAKGFQNLIDKFTFLEADSHKLFNSGSDVLKTLSFETMESPAGMFRNNESAAAFHKHYQDKILEPPMEMFGTFYGKYTKRNNIGILDAQSPSAQRRYSREVILEQHAKWTTGKSHPNSSKEVIEHGKLFDEGAYRAVDAQQGLQGQIPVKGSEVLEKRPGYMRQVWHGANTLSAINKFGRERVTNLIKDGYKRGLGEEATEELVETLSKATIRRAESKGFNLDSSSVSSRDSRAFVRQVLVDGGVDEDAIERLVKGLTPGVSEQGKASSLRHKTPIDLNTVDGDLHILDLMEDNVSLLWSKYARDVAGRASMARKGIHSKADLDNIIQIGVIEANQKGGNIKVEDVQGMFAEFFNAPAHGGVGDGMRRIKQAANLSLLPQFGFAQFAEYGVVAASLGIQRFMHYAPQATRLFRGTPKEKMDAAQELRHFAGNTWNEQRLYNPEHSFEYARNAIRTDADFTSIMDMVLAKGQKALGYVSGYFAIRPLQQKQAILGVGDKFFDHLRRGDVSGAARWADMGLSEKFIGELKDKYVDTGVITWGPNGKWLENYNMSKWDARDIERFSLAIGRFTNQAIQNRMIGETNKYFHKEAWALMTHLNSFPLLAVQKQLSRNMMLADPAALMTAVYGMTSASMAYAIKQILNGNTDNLDAEHILKGGIAMSNMTGFAPTVIDPLLYISGNEDYSLSPYGQAGRGMTLPFLSVATDYMNMARAPFTDGFTKKDAKAFKSFPVLGRAVPFPAIMDALSSDPDNKIRPMGYR